MSQFGAASKNPPWVRSAGGWRLEGKGDVCAGEVWLGAGQGVAMGQSPAAAPQQQQQQQQPPQQMMGQMATNHGMVQYQQAQPAVFQTSLGMQQAGMAMNSMAAMGNTGMPAALGPTQMFQQMGTVSYPAPRALNPAAFAATAVSAAAAPQAAAGAAANASAKQRVFTGIVTKVHDNFGFVDEDVFFQTSCCVKGSNPQVGDRVLVEASYNSNMPFKWNATRIQVLPTSTGVSAPASMPRPGPHPLQQQQQQHQQHQQHHQQHQGGMKGFGMPQQATYNAVPPPGENSVPVRNMQQRKPLGRRGRSRDHGNRNNNNNNNNNNMSMNVNSDEEEVERKRRREERMKEREDKEKDKPVAPAQNRSKSPRVRPVRRTRVAPRYMVQIPKIALDLPEADVLELKRRYSNLYIPSDFFSTSFRWVDAFPPHTPFSLDRPCSFHVMHKDVDPVVENPAVLEPPDADYLFSAKVMLMSMPTMEEIWRKCCSLGEDKEKERDPEDGRDFVHPTRLVNFLVGLRGKNETMAVGGPWSPSADGPNPDKDPSVLIKTAVRTCRALTSIDLSQCTQWYRFLEIYYRRGETTHKGRTVPARVETVVLFLPDVWSCVPTRLEWDGLQLNYTKQLERKLRAEQDEAAGIKSEEKDGDENDEKKDPTHFSLLDPKTMKVNDLRQELEARALSSKGLKSQLIARLAKALKTESDKEEEERERKAAEPAPPPRPVPKEEKREDEEKRKQEEKERQLKEKRYMLPETPHILVHPSRTAKSGKFDCTIMSLSVLLDYRPEDTKEHSFEVSLFAELFNEMLMRDFGFRIYRALHDAPEKPKEEEKDHKKDKKDDKDRKEKKDDRKNGKKDDKDHKDKKDDGKSKSDKEDEEDEDEDDDEDSKDGKKDKDKKQDKDKKKKERGKAVTDDPNLLLSFVYFDQTHCGYILDKDIEELLFILGLNLSRAQVRKLVQKVVTRDSLHYRKLTDKVKKDEEDPEPDRAEKKPAVGVELASLAFGNKHLLPVFCTGGPGSSPPSKRARKANDGAGDASSMPDGYVMYRGSLLHVEKLMQQLKRSEQARLDTEAEMLVVKDELSESQDLAGKLSVEVRDLSAELDGTKTTLDATSKELANVTVNCDSYYEVLREISEKVRPLLVRKTGAQPRSSGKWEGSRWHDVDEPRPSVPPAEPAVAEPTVKEEEPEAEPAEEARDENDGTVEQEGEKEKEKRTASPGKQSDVATSKPKSPESKMETD